MKDSMREVAFLSGLPRSGSTVLANILGMHPDIMATASSPLYNIVQTMKRTWSNDQFFKAQLDHSFDLMNEKARRATLAFIRSWSAADEEIGLTIDKSRGWLHCIEWLRYIMPDFKMIVTIRDLRDIYTSIEKRHRKTLMIDFADGMESNLVDVRANALFNDGGLVGSPLKAIYNIGDIPDITKHLMIWRYEDFLENPQEVIRKTFNFLGVNQIDIDFDNIEQNTYESDSHYNMKFTHNISRRVASPVGYAEAKISPRILSTIVSRFEWYYSAYYPNVDNVTRDVGTIGTIGTTGTAAFSEDDILIRQLDEDIKREARV